MLKIFFTRKFPEIAYDILSKKDFIIDTCLKNSLDENTLIEVVKNYDAILSTTEDKLYENVLNKKKKLKLISNYAVGLDNIDLIAAKNNHIKVCNLPDIVTNSTADLAFSIFLSLIRKIPMAKKYVQDGKWNCFDPNNFVGDELYGKVFGIIGFGRIGQAVAKRAYGFGLNIIYYNKSEKKMDNFPFKQVSLDYLLEKSDYISLHLPLNKDTENFIDIEKFNKMRKCPFLINTARGKVINSDDLILALERKLVKGAALDVTSPEPIEKDSPLLKYDNCLIVPHIGTSTYECREKMAEKAALNILDFFAGV